MVFFNCNACGESLKKNQVEKHYKFKCRQCEVLSCVDCGKEFWGNDYEQHVKCISEEEKYSGKDYKPKANANKGEVKQEAWTRHVQAAVEKAKTNPQLRSLLIQIVGYTNIPRKKAKYENFLRNSMRVRDSSLITQSWELISAEMNAQKEETQTPVENGKSEEIPKSETSEDKDADDSQTTEKKLNKRERKEERQKKNKKKDKKRLADENEDTEAPEKEKKKKKKRKHEESEEEQENEVPATVENGKKKKKKKRKHAEMEEEEEGSPRAKKVKRDMTEEDAEPDTEEVMPRVKFDWEGTIEQCLLAAKGNELSMKKLNKKVLGEFWSSGGDKKIQTEDRALAKFLKTLTKTKRFHVEKNRVRLEL